MSNSILIHMHSRSKIRVLQQKQANHLTGSQRVIHNIDVMWESERFMFRG